MFFLDILAKADYFYEMLRTVTEVDIAMEKFDWPVSLSFPDASPRKFSEYVDGVSVVCDDEDLQINTRVGAIVIPVQDAENLMLALGAVLLRKRRARAAIPE